MLYAALFSLLLIVPLPSIQAFGISSNNNLQNATTITTKEQSNNNRLVPYINPTHGIKIQYPSDWKLVERGDRGYHMLNVIAEFLQPDQSSYYNPAISASHNSIRLSVQDYSSFEDTRAVNQLQNIGNHRIGSIGISCPGFDLKSYIRNAMGTMSNLINNSNLFESFRG